MAMENLSIAQHCDTLRYVCIRSGAYRPQLRRFQQGDYIDPHVIYLLRVLFILN